MARGAEAGRPAVVRRRVRPRRLPVAAPSAGNAPPHAESAGPSALAASTSFEGARRIGESLAIAIVTSTGLYLVGTVYLSAYYARMSIEATAIDLPPPYVALQAIHALPGLLAYPSILLGFWILYRTLVPLRRLRGWFERARQRHPRLLLVGANLVVVAPLLAGAAAIGFEQQTESASSVLAEIAGVLQNAGLILFGYAVWLGWSQRTSIVSQLRARRVLPIALLFLVYLLNALASTAAVAETAAELLITGASDNSLSVQFTPENDAALPFAGKELILVSQRGSTYFAVERQPMPPNQRPVAYMIPAASIQAARVQRMVDADATFDEIVVTIGDPENGE